MNKLLLVIGLFLFSTINLYATHIISGSISYKHILGFKYEITVVTFTDMDASADRCDITINLGDGSTQIVPRANGAPCSSPQTCVHCGDSITLNVRKNIYYGTYTYPSAGTYRISVVDPNRQSGIINIPMSVQVPFYIETELVIPTGAVANNSVLSLSPLVAFAQQGTDFNFNLPVMDEDADILTYELVSPKGAGGNDIPGYTSFTATVDPLSGAFSWNNFPAVGMYVFDIKISECNSYNTLGYTIFELAVYVQPSAANTSFTGLSNWPTDFMGRYNTTIGPNDSIELDLTFTDVNTSSSIGLASLSETFVNGNLATFATVSSSATSITKKFKWKPSSSNLRCAPYIVTFRGETVVNQTKSTNDITLIVFVKDQSVTNCGAICGGIVSSIEEPNFGNFDITISPNPVQNVAVIRFDSTSSTPNLIFTVYDLLGKKVKTIPVHNQNQLIFYKENLPSGVYVYQLANTAKVFGTGKLVIVD